MSLEAFVCEYEGCNLIYENPVTLLCGSSLCQQHLEKFDDKFQCPFCFEEHQKPSISKAITKMIDYNIQLDPMRKKVKESFENLDETIKNYEDIQSDNYIDSYFFEIRNKVDLHREELKKEIDDKSDEIIRTLKEKEEKCKASKLKLQKTNLDDLIRDTLPALRVKFRNPSADQNELNDLLSKMNQNIENIESYLREYQSDSLQNEIIEFEKYEKISLFGKLIIKSDELVLSKSCKLIKEYKEHTDTDR